MIYFCVQFQKDLLFWVNLTFLHLCYHGNSRHFEFVQPLQWIFLQSFIKFDERNPKHFLKHPFFCFHGNCGKVCPTDSDIFGLLMWMLFLSSFINFCLASNLLWSFLCFSFFLAFRQFPWQRQPCWKNQPLKAKLHMASPRNVLDKLDGRKKEKEE